MGDIGIDDDDIDRVLNHQRQGVRKTYNRSRRLKEKRDAL